MSPIPKKHLAIVIVILCCLAGGCDKVSPQPAYKTAIRQHLKDNTPSGKFEEIKWTKPQVLNGNTCVFLKYRKFNGPFAMVDSVRVVVNKNGKITEWNDWDHAPFPE